MWLGAMLVIVFGIAAIGGLAGAIVVLIRLT
jgi:hypothetical protein